MPPETIRAWLREAESLLAAGAHPEHARLDAELVLRHILQQDRAWLIAHADDSVSSHSAQHFEELLCRRILGEPVQYILGETEFHGLTFAVQPAVLIPRPETELLVEHVLHFVLSLESPRILDLGTGSGAIAIALAVACPQAQLVAVDLSPAALAVAEKNAALHRVQDRIDFRASDFFSAIGDLRFDCIVSNPPYVPVADKETLAVEVREHEPALALFAGDDGLDAYRRLIPTSLSHLTRGGMLALEIGFGQKEPVSALLVAAGFQHIEILPDYQRIPRVAVAVAPVL